MIEPITASLAFAGISTLIGAVVNHQNSKRNVESQKQISDNNLALQQERDAHQREIDKIRLQHQDLIQQKTWAVQQEENQLNRQAQDKIAADNRAAQRELAELNHLANQGENRLNREQAERLAELNRQAQDKIAADNREAQRELAVLNHLVQQGENRLNREQAERLAQLNRDAQAELARLNQAFQREENQLNREQSEQLAALTREFQANEGRLSRDHLEKLEIWRSNVQKDLADRQRNLQLELKEIDAKLTWELRYFDRETARIRMREEKMLAQSPIWEAARLILNEDLNTPVSPLHVFVSPPMLKYDTQVSPERQNISLPEMEQYLNGRLRDFFGNYNQKNRPIQYKGASAWMSKVFRGEAAANSIFDTLKSEPTLIIESAVEGDEIEISFAYWGLGYSRPHYFTGMRFSWKELLFDFAKKRTLEWFKRREEEGESESDWIADYDEKVVKGYQHNRQIIEREQKCLARGDNLSDINRNYQISAEDVESLKNFLTICHCLYAGILADEYFLMELSPTHRQPPLLPRLAGDLIKKLRPDEQQTILSRLLQAYSGFYRYFQDSESHWIPDLKLELAEAFMELPEKFGADILLKESIHALDTPHLEIDPNVEISTLLTSLKSKLSINDRDYVERLNRSLAQLGINETIDLADCCYQRAIEYYQSGAYRSSIADFHHTIALRENIVAHYYRGVAHLQVQEYHTAIADFTHIIERTAPDTIVDNFPLLGQAHEQRGIAYSKLREYPTAIADLDRALSLGITTAQTPREIAIQVWEQVQHQQATAEIERQRQEEERQRQEEEQRRIQAEQERERQRQEEEQRWRAAEQERQRLAQLLSEYQEKERREKAAREEQERPTQPMSVDLGSGVKLDLLYIPAGSFLMGSPDSDDQASDNEKPQHRVNVPSFHIGKYPITQEQYRAVMGSNPSSFTGDRRPVENVSWRDAVAFCQELSQLTGDNYRLPSEAEWEYAARGGTTTPYHYGDTLTTDLANFDGEYGETTDVGKFMPNAFGLYDVHGNVWEWARLELVV